MAMRTFVQRNILAKRIKGTVTIIMSARIVLSVDQTIVRTPMALTRKLIVAMYELQVMKIFVRLKILVEWMKVTVIPIVNVKVTSIVDTKIAHHLTWCCMV